VVLELKVPTEREEMRRAVGAIKGAKRVVFENGPLAGMMNDWLVDLVDEIVAADPTMNPLIALAENASDELDARRLGTIDRAGGIHPVYIPGEPYRRLRSLLRHDHYMADQVGSAKNRIKALLRRHGIACSGLGVYRKAGRRTLAAQLPDAQWRWQLGSLWRHLDWLRRERVGARRQLRRACKGIPAVVKLQTIPGVGALVAPTFVAWIVDPDRFESRKKVSSYGGLGLGQNITGWKATSRARASRRGQRELKRAEFIAARSAINGRNALARRYQARIACGWEHRKAIRDIARYILNIACRIMRTGEEYDDRKVNVPPVPGAA
jgi:transposase